jgi:hypothetical protein
MKVLSMFLARLFIFMSFAAAHAASAHEFWIEPQQYQVESGAELLADLRNGENFKGSSLAWFDRQFTRFEMISGAAAIPVTGRAGDVPAMRATAPGNGLLIILHETTPTSLTYTEWPKFLRFAAHKDFPDAEAAHLANGWPTTGFRESYTRHVKALMAVGDGAGADRAFGMATEFVALTNPYDPGFDGTMAVALRYQGALRADAQVEVFDRGPDGTVGVTLHRTDAAGIARIPVTPGHEYLFDAVVLRPAPPAEADARAPVWETLWAALTFRVPD